MEEKTIHTIVIGDSRLMAEARNESIQLIVTSPPYWQLKDYGHKEQIGFDDSYEAYINNLNLVWSECFRALSPGCRLCINIGDQFARSVYYGRYKVIPIRTEIIKFCETIGFDYMGAIIWQKVTTTNTTGGATIMGSYPYPRNGILKLDYEFIMIFKKLGQAPRPSRERKSKSKLSINEWNEYFAGHWYFNGERQDKHLAMFPEELPKRLIKMFSFVGDTVLDPFLGSGTTTLASMHLGRNSIGYEISEEYIPIIRKKLGLDKNELFSEAGRVAIQKQQMPKIDLGNRLKNLPYLFHDSKRLDKRVDPRALRFGSRIAGNELPVGSYHRVKKVIAPDALELETGVRIRLAGIEPLESKKAEAMRLLSEMVLGKQVVLKFDELKYDSDKTLLAYVYLKNKLFINARILKYGVVTPTKRYKYKYKEKFMACSQSARESNNG
jgi:site-specific DNA-methyltransferase (adenine-specific)